MKKMSEYQLNKYKDNTPVKTVEILMNILNKLGIELVEEWMPENNIGTYSLRLHVKNSRIGTNGKGATKEYARASAYAEFLERYQNIKLVGISTLGTVLSNNKSEFAYFPDEKFLSAQEIVKEDNAFIKMYLNSRGITDREEAALRFQSTQKMDFNIFGKKNNYLCVPFYSVKDKKVTYLPYLCVNSHYGSNGMCAGNTLYEALVQGLSEVIERIIHTQIIMEQIILPDIPDEYLKGYPEIYEMYKKVQGLKDYTVMIKDGSLGGKYPVVVLVVVEKNTGKFGIKVGAHPNYSIAIERLFTEATQGITLEKFAKKTIIDFYNQEVSNRRNLQNGFKTSDARYPYQLLSNESEYVFCEPKDVSELNNKELCQSLMKSIMDDGYDVLIHDVSYLGFPSYYIIVPGISELNAADDQVFEAENTRFHVQKLLNNPQYINKENCKYVISVVNYYKSSLLENSMTDLTGYFSDYPYKAKELSLDHIYFLAMCYVIMGDYNKAAYNLKLIVMSSEQRYGKCAPIYLGTYYYLSGMDVMNDHNQVMELLEKMFSKEICKEIDEIFKASEQVIVKQYPTVNIAECKKTEEGRAKIREYLIFEEILNNYKKEQRCNTVNQLELKDYL